jgi:hypothetical protein
MDRSIHRNFGVNKAIKLLLTFDHHEDMEFTADDVAFMKAYDFNAAEQYAFRFSATGDPAITLFSFFKHDRIGRIMFWDTDTGHVEVTGFDIVKQQTTISSDGHVWLFINSNNEDVDRILRERNYGN